MCPGLFCTTSEGQLEKSDLSVWFALGSARCWWRRWVSDGGGGDWYLVIRTWMKAGFFQDNQLMFKARVRFVRVRDLES